VSLEHLLLSWDHAPVDVMNEKSVGPTNPEFYQPGFLAGVSVENNFFTDM
jgi:hypothetical protein